MPDMIETYAGPVAWWEGSSPTMVSRTILDRNLTPDEMLDAAGLRWNVSKRTVTYDDPTTNAPSVVPGLVATVRDTDGQYLGMVGPTYNIVQNEELGRLGEILRGEGATCHTAGSIYGGKQVWMLWELDAEIMVKGDPSKYANYLLLTNGHDGYHTLRFANTPTRVVCANTLHMALGGAKARFSLRHTSGMDGRLDDVRKALGFAADYAKTYVKVANDLAKHKMSLEDLMAFTVKLLPADETVEHAWNTERQRQEIADLFDHSRTLEGVPFTFYRALQAVAEWTDHVGVAKTTRAGNGADRQVTSVLEGPAFDTKSRALALLVASAK
jgi:phage/plasmid-like protein (TIGR03299 family)